MDCIFKVLLYRFSTIYIIATKLRFGTAETIQYEEMYTFPTDNIDGNEDGFNYKTQFSGPETDNSMDGYVNISYLGVVDPNSGCHCTMYGNEKYTTCYNPNACISFPKNYKFSTMKLKLASTDIKILRKNDLGFMNSHLMILMLDNNKEFNEIEPGAFYNMSSMRNISIAHNPQLKYFHPDSFIGCDNMEVLTLIENGFTRFLDFTKALSPLIVPNLRKLRVVKTSIVNITREEFDVMAGTKLRGLYAITCNISYIDPDVLIPLYNLTVLRLIDNSLLDTNLLELLGKIESTKMTLAKFSLSGYRHLPVQNLKAVARTKIKHLSLCCNNKIDMIGEFPEMPELVYLDLRDVNAMNASQTAFKNLPKLKTLLLSKNKLYEGNIWNALFLEHLENLDISDNTQFEDYLLKLYPNVFANMPNLKYLNLSLNNIRNIDNGFFAGLSNLKVLDLENCKILSVKMNSFADLTALEYLDIRKNTFPNRAVNANIFTGLTQLKVLILSGCTIEMLYENKNIFERTLNLRYLDLSHNMLEVLGATIFKPLRRLTHIQLYDNKLRKWDARIFIYNNNLKVVNVQNNMLSTFTSAMMEDFSNLEELNALENRYPCTCAEFKDISNIITSQLLELLEKQPPLCTTPEAEVNTPITDYIEKVKTIDCNLETEDNIVLYIIPSGIIVTVLILTLIIAYMYRIHIRYWCFLAKLALSGSGTYLKQRFQIKRAYKYDAFVSYCNEDHVFVRRLIYMLEDHEPYLKLCVYDRDFKIGTIISESVLECIGDSRRTLLIISDSYIKSQWCRWEVQVAENHRIFFEDEYGKFVNDTLVMVKVGDISSDTVVTPMLRYLMKTRIYLEWENNYQKQAIFWKKLRRALSPPNKLAKTV